MNQRLRTGFCVLISCAWFSGCGGGIPETDSVAIVGVEGDRVVYRYSVPSSSFDTPPSSLWMLDLDTGKSRRFLEATLQFSPKIAGDFYVTELVREQRTVGRVVVGEIGTERRRVIHERALQPHGSDPIIHHTGGDLAAVLTTGNILVTQVSDPDSQRTIDLPACARELIALDDTRAFLRCESRPITSDGTATIVMIDLVTEDVTGFPPPPGNRRPALHGVQVADTHLVVSLINDEGGEDLINQILALDLTAGEWRVVADVGEYNAHPIYPDLAFVSGLEGTDILLERMHLHPLQNEWSLEIIDLETGASRTIVQRSGTSNLIPEGAVLADGRVIWYDPGLKVVVAYDLFLDDTSVFPVRVPN